MTQAYEKVVKMISYEVEEIEEQKLVESEADELLGDLNPRYFEEVITLEETKRRAHISDIGFSSSFNLFGNF
ncbi:MAG: hypothetical protein ACXABO_14885 [Promethearchaeota archaeon]